MKTIECIKEENEANIQTLEQLCEQVICYKIYERTAKWFLELPTVDLRILPLPKAIVERMHNKYFKLRAIQENRYEIRAPWRRTKDVDEWLNNNVDLWGSMIHTYGEKVDLSKFLKLTSLNESDILYVDSEIIYVLPDLYFTYNVFNFK